MRRYDDEREEDDDLGPDCDVEFPFDLMGSGCRDD
jgi:hypothetical protein